MRGELQHLVQNWSFDIPFERSVRAHYPTLQKLVTSGLTWVTIAGALTQAGARHKNGRAISARQMNSVFLRVSKTQSSDSAQVVPLSGTPRVRANEDEMRRLPHPPSTNCEDHSGAILADAEPKPSPRPLTELAQRLAEARRLSEANRAEYDD